MVAPLMRAYAANNTVMTMVMPHIMYYAPDVTDADVGGIPPRSPYPFVMEQGPQGYFIQCQVRLHRLGSGRFVSENRCDWDSVGGYGPSASAYCVDFSLAQSVTLVNCPEYVRGWIAMEQDGSSGTEESIP
jgi:hypothetical protein